MSESFEGYVCWSPSHVNETIVVDAVNSSPAVFLATHRPSQMLRRDFSAAAGGTLIDEEQLLKEFLAPNPGLLFVPIVGESGTGKSHVVRWLHLRLPQDPGRRVVYIPKYGTNLRRVIELILSDMSGDDVVELRRELDRAVDSLDEAGAPPRLLNELAASIEDRSREPRPEPRRPHDDYRQWLEIELPKLLLDNVFRSKLLENGGVIDRLVREALRGKQDEDRSEPFSLSIDDLPLSVTDVARANLDVQALFTQLIDSPTLRDVAVELLNDNLAPAVRKLFGMGGTRLFDVMLSVRRELLSQGVELVLLIEDFTILQGIQRELLDAITEAPRREGADVLCPIRVGMAVTTGYFATIAQTFSTRGEFAGHVFSLDVPLSQAGRGVAPDDVEDFVAGYLNASRLGQERLEAALADAGGEQATHRRWVPNACDDCDHQDTCHEAFGTSRDRFGMYPFNAAALDRVVKSRLPTIFDPRRLLGTVVRYTLDQHREDIRHGEFPSSAFAQHFAASHLPPLDPDLVEDIRVLDAIDADRRVALLTFWGGRPDAVVNLLPGVHQAFALPELPDTDLHRPTRRNLGHEVADGSSAERSRDLPALVERRIASIDQWSDGTAELDQALAADLRKFLHSTVVARIDWDAELLHDTDDLVGGRAGTFFRQSSFVIQNARGGGVRTSTAVSFDLPASPENAALLRSIVLHQHHGHWAFARGDERLRRLLARLDEWAAEVVVAVRAGTATATDWSIVQSATELLMLSARILDVPGAHAQTNVDLTNALLSEAPPAGPRRGTAWDRLVDACSSDNRRKVRDALLNRIGARQGGGATTHAIETVAVSSALTAFKRTWKPTEPPDPAPPEFKRLHADIHGRMDAAIAEELARLAAWHQRTAAAIDPGALPVELSDPVADAAEAALNAGIFEPQRLRTEFTEANRGFRHTRYSVVKDIGELVATADAQPLGKLLSDLAADRSRPIAEIDRFVSSTELVLSASISRGRQQADVLRAGGGADADLRSLFDLLEALRSTIQGGRA
jgi:hypothetical protein